MMIVAGWLMHCVMVATVLSAGAIAWELAARWSGRPARWAWLAALTGSVALPGLLRLLPERVLMEAVPASMPVLLLDGMALQPATSAPALITATAAGLAAWLVASVAMFGYVALMLLQLRRARRTWQQADVDGSRVWVTRGVGPAAVGVRGDVLVPRWALELDADLRRLLLMHEREHVSAGDPRLLLGAIVLLALMPWNPVLWVQVLRLRNAIELDCDARVLRTGVDPRTYGSLLLEVGRRRSANAFVMATFAEPRLFLEERIRRIARWPQPRRPLGAAVLAVVALALFVTAASARDPLRPVLLADAGDVTRDATMAIDTPPAATGLVRYMKRPEVLNPRDAARAVIEAYPSSLRDAGIGGTTWVQVLVDTSGAPSRVMLSRRSGFPAFDEAALAVAQQLRFTPAQNGSVRVAAWVDVPVVFAPAGSNETADRMRVQVAPPRQGEPSEQRAILERRVDRMGERRMTVRPDLLNAAEVRDAMEAGYPPLLRDAGIGGAVVLHLYIGTDGRVQRRLVSKSSGFPALDNAASDLAHVMRFSPFVKDGVRTERWVQFPIVYGDAAVEVPTMTGSIEVTNLSALHVGQARAPTRADEAGAQVRERVGAPAGAQAPVRAPARVVSPDGVDTVHSLSFPRDLPPPAPRQAPSREELLAGPTFTPMTARPELLNRDAVSRALQQSYPPLLRDAGISGSPTVHFLIDDDGVVLKTQLSKPSGYPAMDEAALAVARTMRFSPATNRDAKVPVWVEIPIQFNAK